MKDCGGCTLCCKLLETHDMASERGVYCSQCSPGEGCRIHATRPKECREYQCMWSQMERVGEALRPDRCHIIFDKVSDRTVCAVQHPFRMLTAIGSGQIKAFNTQGFSVFVEHAGNRKLYLAPQHRADDILREIHDRAQLH